jgi:hypothetical protein
MFKASCGKVRLAARNKEFINIANLSRGQYTDSTWLVLREFSDTLSASLPWE